MLLRVDRIRKNPNSTVGKLYVNDVFECFTLEDLVRTGPKVIGEVAIPTGTYVVKLTFSHRFKRILPLIRDVPDFTGIRIHPGNTEADTEGCILVGTQDLITSIGNSRAAFNTLLAKLKAVSPKESLTILVQNNFPKVLA